MYVVILCRMDDNLLELVGLYSSFHVGKIQVSVAEPVRIGQAKNIQVIAFLQLTFELS